MNPMERLTAVLDGKKTDRTPWFADMIYYYMYLDRCGKLPDHYRDEGYLAFCRELGCGVHYYGRHPFRIELDETVRYEEKQEGDTLYQRYVTPLGELTCKMVYSWRSYSHGIVKHFVESIADLRAMCYIFEHTRYSSDYAPLRAVREMLGGDGVIINLPPICASAVQKLTSRWAGIENLVTLLEEDESAFGELIARIEASEDPAYRLVAAFDEPVVEFADNLSSEVTGRRLFETYNAPRYRTLNDMLHSAGKKTGIHIDGTLRPCLALLPACGFDYAEAVTPSPAGDVPLHALRGMVPSDFVIWGGLPGAVFSQTFPEREFDAYLASFAEYAQNDARLIAGVADQVPPDGDLQRVRRVAEALAL